MITKITVHYTTTRTRTKTTLPYVTLHWWNYIPLHFTPLQVALLITTTTAKPNTRLHLQLQVQLSHYNCNYNYATLQETTPHHSASQTLHYTIPPQIQLQLHYTNYISHHHTTTPVRYSYSYSYSCATLHHNTTSSSCRWGDRLGDHCNNWNHKNTTTTFQSISVFTLPSVIDNTQTLV